ncbi:radical SAM protein [Candidatus Woesearchaeota archaeon]|nr:radical SAM protein [Candidatus Woesearchaeota archaeon]
MDNLLVLILTYKCNLGCSYCPTIKANRIMKWGVAKRSLDLFSKLNSSDLEIKFFGGEPLLEFELIKKIVKYNKSFNKNFKYELTTNGILLDKRKIDFLKKNNFELRVSIDGDKKTQLSGRGKNAGKVLEKLNEKDKEYVIVNIVISPKNVNKFYDNFKFLYSKGFRKFNLLPALFNDWSARKITEFKRQLTKIIPFVKEKRIYIKNKDILKTQYLFNEGIVVDYDGAIYNSNDILIKYFEKYKSKLNSKNVFLIKDINKLSFNKNKLNKVLNTDLNLKKMHKLNLKLDFVLTDFVNHI